jgi:hypothetical protein
VSALEDQIRALSAGSLSLAVSRYLHDRPEARERVRPEWLDTGVEAWRGRPAAAIEREAAHRLEVLDAWERDAGPALRESWRLDALHARLNLGSARSGAFGTAAGPLADFLRRAGDEPRTLRLH